MYTNISITKWGGNTHDSNNPCFYNQSHGCRWYLITTFFHSPFCTPFVFSISAGRCSLPGGVMQTFISEGSGPSAVFPELGYFSFLLTLITGHGSTKRCPKGSPAFQIYSSSPPWWKSSPISPCRSGSVTSASKVIPFFAQRHEELIQRHESKVAGQLS